MSGGPSTVHQALIAELLGDVGLLHDRVKDLNEILPDVVGSIRAAGSEAADHIHAEVRLSVAELKQAAVEAETARVRVEISRIVEQTLAQVRKESSAGAPFAWKVRVGLGVCGILLLGGLAGGILGASFAGKPARSGDESKQIEAGRDFLQLLPQLDPATKDKLVRMIQKNRDAGR